MSNRIYHLSTDSEDPQPKSGLRPPSNSVRNTDDDDDNSSHSSESYLTASNSKRHSKSCDSSNDSPQPRSTTHSSPGVRQSSEDILSNQSAICMYQMISEVLYTEIDIPRDLILRAFYFLLLLSVAKSACITVLIVVNFCNYHLALLVTGFFSVLTVFALMMLALSQRNDSNATLYEIYRHSKYGMLTLTFQIGIESAILVLSCIPLQTQTQDSLGLKQLPYYIVIATTNLLSVFAYAYSITKCYQLFRTLHVYKISGMIHQLPSRTTAQHTPSSSVDLQQSEFLPPAAHRRRRRIKVPVSVYELFYNIDNEQLRALFRSYCFLGLLLKLVALAQLVGVALLLAKDQYSFYWKNITQPIAQANPIVSSGVSGYADTLEVIIIAVAILTSVYTFLGSCLPMWTHRTRKAARQFYATVFHSALRTCLHTAMVAVVSYKFAEEFLLKTGNWQTDIYFVSRLPCYALIGCTSVLCMVLQALKGLLALRLYYLLQYYADLLHGAGMVSEHTACSMDSVQSNIYTLPPVPTIILP